uniref:Uncharacterized protein n=1 Tax=Rhizophora mucronata TaxID=61149 RepID=A0A2P2JE40_RHIMU
MPTLLPMCRHRPPVMEKRQNELREVQLVLD